MIQNQENRVSNTFGYNQQAAITIPKSSMNYIVELLSSNLYDDPLKSFLRENISNALDANTENNSQDPVEIKIEEKYNYLEISDSGIGINPQRFKEIYLQLGSSTKRTDNQQIGGFGIGRLSSLACSNNIFIDTIYYDNNTQKYIRDVYNMYKPNIGVQIENIIHDPNYSTQKTGTTIRVYTPFNYPTENLIIQHVTELFPILWNNKKITINSIKTHSYYCNLIQYYKEFDNFTIIDAPINVYQSIFVGNIHYKNVEKLPNIAIHCSVNLSGRYSEVAHLHLIPKLKIGEVSFTPSRDYLRYDDMTIRNLSYTYMKVVNEVFTKLIDYEFKSLDFLKDPNSKLMKYLLNSNLTIKKDTINKDGKYDKISNISINLGHGSKALLYDKFKCLTCKLAKDSTSTKMAFLDSEDILNFIFNKKANIVITNRIINEPFCKEKSTITTPTIFINITKYLKEHNTVRIIMHKLLSELFKYLPKGTVTFESRSDFEYVKSKTKRISSDILKVQFLTDSDKSNYNTYNTKLVDEYITVDTTKEYPILVTENSNPLSCLTLRYLYRFYKDIGHDTAVKLFPKEMRFGVCSTTTLVKLTTAGKAISLNDYITQNSLTINIVKLINKHYKMFANIGRLYADLVRFLYNVCKDTKTIDNIVMIINIAACSLKMYNSDVYNYMNCRNIDNNKFGNLLPILKDILYNKSILSLREHELYKYFIPRYSNIKLQKYGKR